MKRKIGRPNLTPGVVRVLKALRLEPDVVTALERASEARGQSTGELANRILKKILIESVQDDTPPTNQPGV